jgi:hypothetical protein
VRIPSDRRIGKLVNSGSQRLRLWAARKAADRGLHWSALRGASQDPYVLERLGLYPLAARQEPGDEKARFARLIAAAALGGPAEDGFDQYQLDDRTRTRIARALAPADPAAAARLLPSGETLANAACRLALGDIGAAKASVGDGNSRETWAVRAHIACAEQAWRPARKALNALFAADGLSPVLTDHDEPVSVDLLESRDTASESGPLVSVIMPYHNASATLRAAVESLLRQSWRNLEILLVDDRSSDESAAMAAQLSQEDQRITCLENCGKPGVYGARNTALARASGDYIAFLDADDWAPAERLARQVRSLGRHAVALANHVRMDDGGRIVAPRVFPLVRPVPITLIARKSVFAAAGPFDEVATGADSEMLGRLEMQCGKAAIIRDPAVLLVARWRSGSLSQQRDGGMFGAERFAYRAEWMFRHAGIALPRLPLASLAE